MRRLLLLLIPLALVTAACGGDDSSTDSGSPDMTMPGHGGEGMSDHPDNSPVADGARIIEVTARSFEFDPDSLEVDLGEDIAIELHSEDAEHDFVFDGNHVVAAEAGETATGGFTAPDEAGSYDFYCTVEGHREAGMEGTLVVSE
jgi:plastocyanin